MSLRALKGRSNLIREILMRLPRFARNDIYKVQNFRAPFYPRNKI
jgi:hypothetical protein